jgi:hypothetical protein
VEGDCFIILSVLLLKILERDELLLSCGASIFFEVKETTSLATTL